MQMSGAYFGGAGGLTPNDGDDLGLRPASQPASYTQCNVDCGLDWSKLQHSSELPGHSHNWAAQTRDVGWHINEKKLKK